MSAPPPESMRFAHGRAQIRWRRHAAARRICLRIEPRGGVVIVTLPPRRGRAAGLALLRHHAAWVSACLAALPAATVLADGARIPLAGRAHHIRYLGAGRARARIAGREILVSGAPEHLARTVRACLRAEARRRFTLLAARKAARAAVPIARLVVRDSSTRWGSCAADGTLAFSWRLLLAPAFVQDYAVAHEVAHLRHMDHGAQFWSLVDELSRHRKSAAHWLATHGAGLLRVG
jgi:predicted metal-dependent hydrolase